MPNTSDFCAILKVLTHLYSSVLCWLHSTILCYNTSLLISVHLTASTIFFHPKRIFKFILIGPFHILPAQIAILIMNYITKTSEQMSMSQIFYVLHYVFMFYADPLLTLSPSFSLIFMYFSGLLNVMSESGTLR